MGLFLLNNNLSLIWLLRGEREKLLGILELFRGEESDLCADFNLVFFTFFLILIVGLVGC